MVGSITLRRLYLAAGMTVATIAAAQANLLSNGGFETPDVGPAAFLNIAGGAEPVGFAWTVTVNTVDVFSNGVLGTGSGTVFEGNQALDLVGLNSTGGISQSFATIPGQAYLLTFAYANNPINTGGVVASASVLVTGDGGTALSTGIAHSSSTGSNFDWTPFSGSFVASGTTSTLSFTTTGGGGNGGIFLDAVSIVAAIAPPPTDVPEPASLALLTLGLAGLGLARSRRA